MPFATDSRAPLLKPLSGVVSGVGASQTAVVKIPPGVTYGSLILNCTIAGAAATRAQLESMLTSIRLTVSGVEKFTLTGKQLIAIVEYYTTGLIADTGFLTIPFERLWMNGADEQQGPEYGTLGESSVQIEIVQSAGSTIDSITVFAEIETVAEGLGAHMRIVRVSPSIASTGVFLFDGLPKNPAEFLYALHFQVPVVANFTNLAIVGDNIRLVDAPFSVINRRAAMGTPARTPQTAALFTHFDFCSRGFGSDALPLSMGQLSLEMTFANAAPNTISVLAEIATRAPTQAGATR